MDRLREIRYGILKRAFDMLASAAGLMILSPVFLVIFIIVKIDSRGPAFFKQNRIGLNGRTFRMYKFRTMIVEADKQIGSLAGRNEMKVIVFKMRNDPRVTRVGRLLRKTSLDELPQLLNVLKGEMSLVGPRPPLVREAAKYEGWHAMRLTAKPGITGLWQISGRNTVDFNEMVRLDFKYIRESGLIYDLKILLRTLPLLFGDENAY